MARASLSFRSAASGQFSFAPGSTSDDCHYDDRKAAIRRPGASRCECAGRDRLRARAEGIPEPIYRCGTWRRRDPHASVLRCRDWIASLVWSFAGEQTGRADSPGNSRFVLLLLIISGGFLWLPGSLRWQRLKAASLFRSGLAGRARAWNRHSVLGLWLALPIAVITITGAIMAFAWATNLLYLATSSPLSEASHAATVTRHGLRQDAKSKQPISFVEMQQIVDNVERQAAGWRTLQMAMPDREDRSIKVSIDFLDDSRPDQTVEMVVDRRTGAILKSNTFSSRSLGAKLRLFTRPIHTGSAGGLVGQTAAGITSLGCCWLVWTGISMSMRRLRGSAIFARRSLRADRANVPLPATSHESISCKADHQHE